MGDPRAPLGVGDRCAGFRVARVVPLEDLRAHLCLLEHEATGARYLHLANRDQENTFAVMFPTFPTDSTGVAHILEHTVLCGSAKFPVRDPFFSMVKRSLNTFMNAFTASDWTMYPFATQNRKDFYNLMDVYLDAVFRPRLDDLSFKQEGHRLEEVPGANGEAPLAFKGVVYNEMKGAMSAPDQILGRALLAALYPDTTYRHNSGGDPREIPRLTHADLQAFHRRHYHPSNAFFYSYGNLPLADHLAFLETHYLGAFTRQPRLPEVPPQPRWSSPRQTVCTYPIAPTEDLARRSQVGLAWLATDIRDAFEVLVLDLLEQILLGHAASPLRKALMDSGLGSALADATGYEADNRDTLFACGLKDTSADAGPAVEALILETLDRLARQGVPAEAREAALHQLEFQRREVTNTPYPYGIKLLLALAATWLHGGDAPELLRFTPHLERLRQAAEQPGFLEERLRHHFLDNPHRVRFALHPDPQEGVRQTEAERLELARREAHLTPDERRRLGADAAALETRQAATEDLGVLPTLELTDIPAEVTRIAPTRAQDPGLAFYEQPTAGIVYFAAAFHLAALPAETLPLVPFFCRAFTRLGTARRDFADLARRLDLYTGGLGLSANARSACGDPPTPLAFLALSGKCLDRHLAPMCDLVEELLFEVEFSDLARLRQVLREYRAGFESTIVNGGHRYAMSLASRWFTPAARLNETWNGIHQLRFVKGLTEDTSEARLADLAAQLTGLARILFPRAASHWALIGDPGPLATAAPRMEGLRQRLAEIPFKPWALPETAADGPQPREGWSTASAVSFAAQAFPSVSLTHADAPAMAVIAKMLRSLYLHREIREKGGAYGGFAVFNPEDGLFAMASYRDPQIAGTLRVFEGARSFLLPGSFREDDVKEAVLQVCSEIDKPDPPGPAARKAFYRRLLGLSDEERQRFKARLLALDATGVRQAAERRFPVSPAAGAVAVIGAAEALEAANRELAPSASLTLHRI
jgi:Zn-dependent M16 (insulinase) family peptidase